MPLHDYECKQCEITSEHFVKWDEYTVECPHCGATADRVYRSFKGISHEAPDWMKDTLQVVDKEGGQHCQEFLKNPNRSTYKNWMKGEGLRPLEEGESMKRKKMDTQPLRKKVRDKFRKDNTITVGGRA